MDTVYDFRKVIIRETRAISRHDTDDQIIHFYTSHMQDAAMLYEAGAIAEAEAICNILLLDPDMPFLSRVLTHVYLARLAQEPDDFKFHCDNARDLCIANFIAALYRGVAPDAYLIRCERLGHFINTMLSDIFKEKAKGALEAKFISKSNPEEYQGWLRLPEAYKEEVSRSLSQKKLEVSEMRVGNEIAEHD